MQRCRAQHSPAPNEFCLQTLLASLRGLTDCQSSDGVSAPSSSLISAHGVDRASLLASRLGGGGGGAILAFGLALQGCCFGPLGTRARICCEAGMGVFAWEESSRRQDDMVGRAARPPLRMLTARRIELPELEEAAWNYILSPGCPKPGRLKVRVLHKQ